MAARIRARARQDKALAETMARVADAMKAGSLSALKRVTKKTQYEALQSELTHAHWRYGVSWPSHKGNEPTIECVRFAEISEEDRARFKRIGITRNEQLREALAELIEYRKPAEKECPIQKAERDLVGRKIPGFFSTPKPLAKKLVEMARIESGMTVLEPSAGKGDIAQVIKTAGASVACVEVIPRLREILSKKGFELIGYDFLEVDGQWDRIIMNPPFEKGQDVAHISHALDLLKPGGRLVTIASAGVYFRNDRIYRELRDKLEKMGGRIEANPAGAFKESGTAVNTVTIVVDKPATRALAA